MEPTGESDGPTLEETVESLAETIAHLALQLTVAQVQLRALASELGEARIVDSRLVTDRAAALAREHAAGWLSANMGPTIGEMVDQPELTRQIVEYLSVPDL